MFRIEKSNSFGDRNYSMKERYNADNLFVAKLRRISSDDSEYGPMIQTTEQKYIFEKLVVNNKIQYREVFSGFTTKDINDTVGGKYFDLPYVTEPRLFTDYLPETVGITIPKLSLIWVLNDINCSKNKSDSHQLKRQKK